MTADLQTEITPVGDLYEVLTQAANGHRTVHRFRAKDRAAAERTVTEGLADDATVVGVAKAGCGLGSGD